MAHAFIKNNTLTIDINFQGKPYIIMKTILLFLHPYKIHIQYCGGGGNNQQKHKIFRHWTPPEINIYEIISKARMRVSIETTMWHF